jgi:hypothetical protein
VVVAGAAIVADVVLALRDEGVCLTPDVGGHAVQDEGPAAGQLGVVITALLGMTMGFLSE